MRGFQKDPFRPSAHIVEFQTAAGDPLIVNPSTPRGAGDSLGGGSELDGAGAGAGAATSGAATSKLVQIRLRRKGNKETPWLVLPLRVSGAAGAPTTPDSAGSGDPAAARAPALSSAAAAAAAAAAGRPLRTASSPASFELQIELVCRFYQDERVPLESRKDEGAVRQLLGRYRARAAQHALAAAEQKVKLVPCLPPPMWADLCARLQDKYGFSPDPAAAAAAAAPPSAGPEEGVPPQLGARDDDDDDGVKLPGGGGGGDASPKASRRGRGWGRRGGSSSASAAPAAAGGSSSAAASSFMGGLKARGEDRLAQLKAQYKSSPETATGRQQPATACQEAAGAAAVASRPAAGTAKDVDFGALSGCSRAELVAQLALDAGRPPSSSSSSAQMAGAAAAAAAASASAEPAAVVALLEAATRDQLLATPPDVSRALARHCAAAAAQGQLIALAAVLEWVRRRLTESPPPLEGGGGGGGGGGVSTVVIHKSLVTLQKVLSSPGGAAPVLAPLLAQHTLAIEALETLQHFVDPSEATPTGPSSSSSCSAPTRMVREAAAAVLAMARNGHQPGGGGGGIAQVHSPLGSGAAIARNTSKKLRRMGTSGLYAHVHARARTHARSTAVTQPSRWLGCD
eukprot:COSAG01_NODE_657_length_14457_cov_99.379649_9_plen_628_part_00